MVFNYTLNRAEVAPAEPSAAIETNRLKPELGHVAPALDVDVCGLVSITREEKESVGTNA